MMAAAQALDIRVKQQKQKTTDVNTIKMGKGTSIAHQIIREHVEYLDEDRPLYRDHNAMVKLLKSNKILEAVEKGLDTKLN